MTALPTADPDCGRSPSTQSVVAKPGEAREQRPAHRAADHQRHPLVGGRRAGRSAPAARARDRHGGDERQRGRQVEVERVADLGQQDPERRAVELVDGVEPEQDRRAGRRAHRRRRRAASRRGGGSWRTNRGDRSARTCVISADVATSWIAAGAATPGRRSADPGSSSRTEQHARRPRRGTATRWRGRTTACPSRNTAPSTAPANDPRPPTTDATNTSRLSPAS